MTLHDLLDPIYDPAPTVFDAPRWRTSMGQPMPWVGTLEGDPVEGPWEPIDLSLGGEGGGE